VNQTKAEIRTAMLSRRNALSAEQVASLSERIQAHLLDSAVYAQAKCVAWYAAFQNEVRTDRLLARALGDGKQVLFPRMRGRGPDMDFCEVKDPGEMVLFRLGFREPADSAPAVPPETIDLMLLPGLAFDRQGYRLGFGAGCYDRVLPRLRPEAWTCGAAYGFQVVGEVPQAAHDVPVKLIVTEAGFIPIPTG
jgi:5-formyltetrahydrofolate cyclo-ligase